MAEHEDKRDMDERDQPHESDGHADRAPNNDARAKGQQDDGDELIELEQVEESSEQQTPTTSPGDRAPRKGVPLEEQFACPNCNALMPDKNALVCMRCGFDMKTLRVQQTRIAKPKEIEEDEDEEADEEGIGAKKPICRPGRGDLWLPAIVGGASALLLIVGYFAAAPGLYPDIRAAGEAVAHIGFIDRMLGLVKFLIIIGLLGGCGMGGLWMLSLAISRPIGNIQLAAARIGAIVLIMRLVTFINFGEQRQIEFMVEGVLQAGLFIGLSIVAFALKPRTALMLGGFALMMFLAIWLAARLIVLATWQEEALLV